MRRNRLGFAGRLAAILALAVLLAACAEKKAPAPKAGAGLDPAEARAIATEAYLYGYPLVTMEMTRRVMTNVAAPENGHAPMNEFAHVRRYPPAGFRDVTMPNADTLYSTAWLDLSAGPMVLSLPDTHGRYYVMPILSAWTGVIASPGARTTGTGPQTYAITGPDWRGSLPSGMSEIKSPTNLVWILGRTSCTGSPSDYEAAHAVQNKYLLVPLPAWGKPAPPAAPGRVDPAVDMKTPVRDQVDALPAGPYFRLLAKLLRDNPPTPEDAPLLARMARLGIVPGQDFDLGALPPELALAAAGAPAAGQARMASAARSTAETINGWSVDLKMGVYDSDYGRRALTARRALAANRPQDEVYAVSTGWYRGEGKYVLRFPSGQLPPVNAFWSLTLYDGEFFFAANPLNRFSLGSRDALKHDEDGSVTIHVQHESPGPDREANWLPAPEKEFNLVLRLYWPKSAPPSILDGSWAPPEIELAR